MSGTLDVATLRPNEAGAGGIPAAWRTSAVTADLTTALDALETYKKKDPSKGVFCTFFLRERKQMMMRGKLWFGSRLLEMLQS